VRKPLSSTHTTVNAPASVPVRPPSKPSNGNGDAPPIWPIENALDSETTPLTAKCVRISRVGGVYCKELKAEERRLIDPDVVRDVSTFFSFSISILLAFHLFFEVFVLWLKKVGLLVA
jgi:vacuolar iron transporter family protein